MIVANAVAVLPIRTERLDGRTAATSAFVFPVVMRPILLPLNSVNQSAPSGPAVISNGSLFEVGTGYSVIVPEVVMRPILLPD